MTTNKNYRPVMVGLFILVGIAILVVTIFTLGGQKKTFAKSFLIHAVFNDVGGLIKGGNVWYSGVKIGTVKSIDFSKSALVKVTMGIESTAQVFIHKNAYAKIGSDGLIGNKIVVIYGGDSTVPHVVMNDFLQVEKAQNTDDMMVTLQANNKNLLEITKTFLQISKKIDSGDGTLATIINDRQMANSIKGTLTSLQAASNNFKAVSANSREVIANLQLLTNDFKKTGNSIHDIMADTLLYGQVQNIFLQLDKSSASINQLALNLKAMSDQLEKKNSLAGVILHDTLAGSSLKTILKNMESGSQKLDEDLEALQHNFLFRGYFRKKEKAGKQVVPLPDSPPGIMPEH